MAAAKTIYDNLAFTHKVHEKQAELMAWGSKALRLLILASLLFSLGVQLAPLIPGASSSTLTVLGVISTIIGIGLSFYQLNFNYDKLLDAHREIAKELLAVKNRMIIAMDGTISKSDLEDFVNEVNPIYQRAPQTGWLANAMASKNPKRPKRR